MWIEGTPICMQLIITYLRKQMLSKNKEKAHKLWHKATHYVLQDDVLYKR